MFRGWVAFMVFALSAERAPANDLLRLYQLALARDAVLQAASAQRDAAVEVRPQALSRLLPQVTASGSGARERAESETAAQVNGQAGNCSLAGDTQKCFGNPHGYGVNLSQTLWSFEAVYHLKEANRQAASAEATLVDAQQALLLRVAQAYFAMLEASDQLATTVSERAAFATLLNQAKVRQQTGVSARSDVEQAQSFYDATEQSVIDAQNALDDASLALAEIVGEPVKTVAPLVDDIPLVPPEPQSVEEWVELARHDNPALQAAHLQVEAADYDISAQRGRGLPSLAVVSSSSRTWQNLAIGGNQALDTVGLTLQWPLFQGGAVHSAMRQSRALYREALAQYESALRATETRARAAYRGILTGIHRVDAAKRAVESARIAVDASQHNVEFGTGTEFDLLNSQNNYSTSVRAYSQTRYDYLTSVLVLKQQAGRLTEHDLAQIDALLVLPHS